MIEVIYAQPQRYWRYHIAFKEGVTAEQAEHTARENEPFCWISDYQIAGFAVWGQEVSADHVLADGDRLELLRPLQVDPMTARRRRAEQSNKNNS